MLKERLPVTTPALSVSTPYGRLYRQPGTADVDIANPTQALRDGLLMPSVTNVISVGEKPYLRTWHAKLAAETAIETVQQHPGLIEAKPDKALRYLRDAAERKSLAAAELGTEVHRIVEHLARGEDAGERWPQAAPYVESWHTFMDDYQPRFLHIESTFFGTVDEDLHYAGTADFVAEINGVVVVGDYKCVVPETPILMWDGSEKRACELVVGDSVVSYDQTSGKLTTSLVEEVRSNGMRPTVVLTMVGGRTLRATLDHPVLIARPSRDKDWAEQRTWVKAEDVRPGDQCVLALGSGGDTESALPFAEAYLMGVLVGDGTLGPRSALKFTNSDPAIVREVDYLLRCHGGRLNRSEGVNRDKDYWMTFGRRRAVKSEFRSWLEDSDMRHTAREKVVPPAVMTGGVSAWIGFLSGLLDADGHIRDTKDSPLVDWNSSSYELLRQCQQLLANLGIVGHITEIRQVYRGKDNISWRLAVHNREGVQMCAYLLRPVGEKRQRLLNLLPKVLEAPNAPRGTSSLRQRHPELIRVTSVEVISEPTETIAITVEGTHTHVTGGIVTHNTGRSVHTEASLQAAALAHGHEVADDTEHILPAPKIEAGIIVHLTPNGYRVHQADITGTAWEAFCGYRRVWDWHVRNLASRSPLHVSKPLLGPTAITSERANHA